MDPYKTPKSDLLKNKCDVPTGIYTTYSFIALSFLIFLVEEFSYAANSESGILDPYNYIFVPIWGGLLFWLTQSIRKQKDNPKNTFLLLAIVVVGISIYAPIGAYSIYTGLGEAMCFLIVYFILSNRTSKAWFE